MKKRRQDQDARNKRQKMVSHKCFLILNFIWVTVKCQLAGLCAVNWNEELLVQLNYFSIT